RDVTWLSQFFSNDDTTVSVKPDGLVKALRAGESSVRVHFQGQVDVIRFTMPFETMVASEQFNARQNAIDLPVFEKLKALHIPPSPPCDDQTFLRRASLDATGTLPTPEEITAFLSDTEPEKRARLVDALLNRPEFIDYWTLQLADVLQNRKERDHDVRGTKGVRAFHSWLRAEIAANRPWNELARAILLTNGTVDEHPELGYFLTVVGEKQKVEESELPDSVAQSFLGTRIGCARCHNHPLEKYTQDDFYRFAAFFSKVALKRAEPGKGLSALSTVSREEEEQLKKIEEATARFEETRFAASSVGEEPGGEELLKKRAEHATAVTQAKKRLVEIQAKPPGVNQPRTGKMMAPMPLDRTAVAIAPGSDPREAFVTWMLGTENFSGAMVNRLWKHFFKVGLVEPVDDLRASNPPSNGELWTLLNKEFVSHGYDLKHIMRLILNSRAYQLSSDTLAGNEKESKFFSHYYARRLPAEVLTDGIAGASEVPTAFPGYPVGTRAIQLPDPGVGSYFLSLFGRSERVTACACERAGEVTLPQLLHLHNSDDLLRQIQSNDGRLHALLNEGDDHKVIDNLLLATASRHATAREIEAVTKALGNGSREAVFQDFFWALLNSKEFSFNH
ncbi:MAG: hypothetical protein JWL90_252, partial [Chthoniobacteraceae bacterium]|nr:hypothetical protein [Chthoniobacteraceae bacterium]